MLVWDGGGHIWIHSSMFDILLVSWNGQICRQALSQRVHPFLRLSRGGNGETNIESESGGEPCRLFSHVPQISYMHGHSSLEISVEILRECIFCLLPKMSTSWMCLTNCFPLSIEFSPVIWFFSYVQIVETWKVLGSPNGLSQWHWWTGWQGREDDNLETIRKRFKVFLDSAVPIVNHYVTTGKVHKVLLPRTSISLSTLASLMNLHFTIVHRFIERTHYDAHWNWFLWIHVLECLIGCD